MGLHSSDYRMRLVTGRLFVLGFLLFMLSLPGPAKADAGADWLAAQGTPEGSYEAEGDPATGFQATAEALHTLHLLGAISPAGFQNSLSYLDADSVKNTEHLSRIILINSLAGTESGALINDLLAHQNADGGFAEFAGFESTPLDTAFALTALALSGNAESQAVGGAIAYLAGRQNPDGGYALSGSNESDVYVTSAVLSALQRFIFQYNVSAILSAASEHLFSKQLATGGWGSDWETAHALLAVAPITTDVSRYADAVSVLQGAQNTDGSWGGSVYSTALALRALQALENLDPPVDVNTGMFTGRVVEDSTQTPLSHVSVSLNDASNTTVLSDVDGSFVLSNVQPGSYTLTYAADGYGGATQAASVNAGQRVDVGTIRLPRLPDTGILSGIVTDADSGLPVSGAAITSSGALNATATTLADGSFKLVSLPGQITVSVNADGYLPVSAVGTIVAGGTLNFSPALSFSDTPPSTDPVTLSGSVKDSSTGLPITGASINVQNSTVAATSGTDGNFTLAPVDPGNLTLMVSAAGYMPVQSSVLAVAGSKLDIGTVYLSPESAQLTSTVTGWVRDSATGLPVAGASVAVEGSGLAATTDASGHYTISAIEPLSFSLLASSPGYISQFSAVALAEPTTSHVDFTLEPFSQGGVVIDFFAPDMTSYPAYSPAFLSASVRNSGTEGLTVKVLMEVMNDQGDVLQQLQAAGSSTETGLGEPTVILPDAVLDVDSEWNTGIHAPGIYQARVRVFDQYTNRLLAERQIDFAIAETAKVETLTLSATPKYSNVGAEQEIELIATVVNRSNTEHAVNLQYQWYGPDGALLQTGETQLPLVPGDVVKTQSLARFPYTFTSSGEYPFNVQLTGSGGTTMEESGLISVAPSVRLELDQAISPETIVPDGDKRVSIKIRLKGVEE